MALGSVKEAPRWEEQELLEPLSLAASPAWAALGLPSFPFTYLMCMSLLSVCMDMHYVHAWAHSGQRWESDPLELGYRC